MSMNKDKLKKISQSFKESTGVSSTREEDRKRRMELQSAEEPDMSNDEDSGYSNTKKEDAELPEGAGLKDRVTMGIIKMMRKKGPPAK